MQSFYLILYVIYAFKLRISLERLERLLVFDKLITDKKVKLSKFLQDLKADKISHLVYQFHPCPTTNTVLSGPFKTKPSPKGTVYPRELSMNHYSEKYQSFKLDQKLRASMNLL